MQRIVILISGRGSNMQAIVARCRTDAWPAQVVAVLADRPEAAGLRFAAEHGLATAVIDHRLHASRPDFDGALAAAVDAHAPDLVLLAGFMRILGQGFVQRFAGRVLNIHPSLLPAFPGLHTHRLALEAGCKLAGATVHLVTPALDHGPIIAQAVVPVLAGDNPRALAERVLVAEHLLYPLAVGWWVRGELSLADGIVSHRTGQSQCLFLG
jgi:phosphoribosylglycinamide formyltransferase-1